MSEELDKAVAELLDNYSFCMSICALPGEDIVKRIEVRDPEYLARTKVMDDPPGNVIDLWAGFCVWSVTSLQKKYEPIWGDVARAYFDSDARKQAPPQPRLAELIWTRIEEGF